MQIEIKTNFRQLIFGGVSGRGAEKARSGGHFSNAGKISMCTCFFSAKETRKRYSWLFLQIRINALEEAYATQGAPNLPNERTQILGNFTHYQYFSLSINALTRIRAGDTCIRLRGAERRKNTQLCVNLKFYLITLLLRYIGSP